MSRRRVSNNNDVYNQLLKMAAEEMVESGISEIMPIHLLIALSRLSEGQSSDGADDAATVLRHEFELLGIEPRRFRRRLRALLPNRSDKPHPTTIHRSQSAQSVFMLAKVLARASAEEPSPSHLLRATFLLLADMHVTDRGGYPGSGNDPADDEIPDEL